MNNSYFDEDIFENKSHLNKRKKVMKSRTFVSLSEDLFPCLDIKDKPIVVNAVNYVETKVFDKNSFYFPLTNQNIYEKLYMYINIFLLYILLYTIITFTLYKTTTILLNNDYTLNIISMILSILSIISFPFTFVLGIIIISIYVIRLMIENKFYSWPITTILILFASLCCYVFIKIIYKLL